MAIGVYLIEDTLTGKQYVGSSVNMHARWRRHLSDLKWGRHPNPKLQAAWQKHGPTVFSFRVLEELQDPLQLIAREDAYILALQPWYNCLLASQGGRHKPTGSFRQRLSASLRGRTFTLEHRLRIGAANRGRTYTAETRAKIACASAARRHSDTTKAKLAQARLGHVHSAEVRERIRKSNVGKHDHVGVKHPRFDHTVYQFEHRVTGRTFSGTRHAFYTEQGLSPGMVSEMVRGLRELVKGWALVR